MRFLQLCSSLLISLWTMSAGMCFQDTPSVEELDYFEKHIRPVLAAKCYDCHSASVQAKGGLRLDTKDGLLVGGQSGPSIVPGDASASLLIEALRYDGLQMPPKERLPEDVIAKFEEWIQKGAADPRIADPATKEVLGKRQFDFEKEREHWAWKRPELPAVLVDTADQWSWSEIDRLVYSSLSAASLSPAPDADRATWIRRVYLDLIGLPPSPEEVLNFELDTAADAREKIVDRLLASPRFGERWGRHWLDVARFGESTGKERNFVFLQSWRYRDYVIDSFNDDKPFDTFVREQIAGDLLPHRDEKEKDIHHIATGFLALSPKGINDRNRESFLLEIVDEQIESVGRGLMGISIGCARCHDHKYDAIPTTDYYALAGIFRSSEVRFGMLNRQRNGSFPELLVPLESDEIRQGHSIPSELIAKVKQGQEQFQKKQRKVRRLRQAVAKLRSSGATPLVAASETTAATSTAQSVPPATSSAIAESGPVPPVQSETLTASVSPTGPSETPVAASDTTADDSEGEPSGSLEDLEKRLEQQEKKFREFQKELDELNNQLGTIASYALAIAVVDRPGPADIHVRIRGEVDRPGNLVPRGFLSVIPSADDKTNPLTGSGRLQLSEWLTSPENPLVARVYVNRIWSKLLGQGIVSTPDDFGVQGQRPVNGPLLDLLAVRFVEQGWSTKSLIRSIVLSHVYSTGSVNDEHLRTADPENHLFGRWNRRRLEAEVIRDSVLSIAGTLDLNRPSGTPLAELGTRELGAQADFSSLEKPTFVRSVYLPALRGKLPEMLALFDMADPSLTTGRRDTTSGPDQALYLLNSPMLTEQSTAFASRVIEAVGGNDRDGVDLAFRIALGHKPGEPQIEAALGYLQSARSVIRAERPDTVAPETANVEAWSQLCQALFALPEFRYVF